MPHCCSCGGGQLYLADLSWQRNADQMRVLDWSAVQEHQIACCCMIADNCVSLPWDEIRVMPADIQAQQHLKHCTVYSDQW